MTTTDVIYLVGACCGVLAVAVWVGMILVPAWTAYERVWQRLAAGVLSLYVLVGMIGVGLLAGFGVYSFWTSYISN